MQTNVIKAANKLTSLIVDGDLLIIQDRTTNYPYRTFPYIYEKEHMFDYDCAIYRLMEIYFKNAEGDYIKIAARNSKGELELL